MKTLLVFIVTVLILSGCAPDKDAEFSLSNIKLMEPTNVAIIKNKIKVAHMICAEHSRCETNNDTIVSTYYDAQGRLRELWRREDNYGELYEYVGNTNWETKRTITTKGSVTYNVSYDIKQQDKTMMEYTIDGADTVETIKYEFDDKGYVTKYSSDKSNLVNMLQYSEEGLVTKLTIQYPDTSFYIKSFGLNEMEKAYKVEEDYEYFDGHIDNSIRRYYDIYGNKFFEPTTFKYRYDGLMESIDGRFRYIFSYGK
jgi:hypothetical protein